LEEWIKQRICDKQAWKRKHSVPKYQNVEVGDSVNIEEVYTPKYTKRITIERLRGNDFYLIEYQLKIRLDKQRRRYMPYE
jgi:hypothetical protein